MASFDSGFLRRLPGAVLHRFDSTHESECVGVKWLDVGRLLVALAQLAVGQPPKLLVAVKTKKNLLRKTLQHCGRVGTQKGTHHFGRF